MIYYSHIQILSIPILPGSVDDSYLTKKPWKMKKSSQDPSCGQGLDLAIISAKAIASAIKKNNADSARLQRIIGKPGVIFKFYEDLLAKKDEVETPILRLISGDKKIVIKASDGKAIIANATSTFRVYIHNDFKTDPGLDAPGPATPEMLVDVYETIEDATKPQVFACLNSDLDKLVMTPSQIKLFCDEHPDWFKKDDGNLFLTKVDDNGYFVIDVGMISTSQLYIEPRRLKCDDHYYHDPFTRIFVPSSKPLTI